MLQLTGIASVFNLLVFVIFLIVPGYFWTLAFFPQKKALKRVERIVFSVVFSVTILPLFVLLENTFFSIPVDFFSVFSTLLVLIIVSILIFFIRSQRISSPAFIYRFFPKIKKEESVELFPKF